MNYSTRSIRFSAVILTSVLVLGLFATPSAFAQRGGRGGGGGGAAAGQRGGGSAARGRQGSPRNQAKNGVKNAVKNKAVQQGKNRAKNVYQNRGKNIVKQKAQANGITRQQVLNNQNRVQNRLQNGIAGRAKNRTRSMVQNNGRAYAKNQIKNKVKSDAIAQGKNRAKDFYQNHGKDVVKNWAQQNGYSRQQVLNHRNQIDNRLKHGIKDRAINRTKNRVQQGGKAYAKNQLQQYGRNQVKQNVKNHVKNKAKDYVRNNAKNHVKDYVRNRQQWHWHQGHSFNQQTWGFLNSRARYLRANVNFQWTRQRWVGYYPLACGWWYDYCGSANYFDPTCTSSFDWTTYSVPEPMLGAVEEPNMVWNLGLQLVLIPEQGLGIEAVAPGSPADTAGLVPGMIITSANGIALIDELAMPAAIDESGGILDLEILISPEELVTVTVEMEPILID